MRQFIFRSWYYKGISGMAPEKRLAVYDAIASYVFDAEIKDVPEECVPFLGAVIDSINMDYDRYKRRLEKQNSEGEAANENC